MTKNFKKSIVLILLLFTISLASVVYGQLLPPMILTGTVMYNGVNASVGTLIEAFIQNDDDPSVADGTHNLTQEGWNSGMVINGNSSYGGYTVTFKINGVEADQTAIYNDTSITHLNLTAYTTVVINEFVVKPRTDWDNNSAIGVADEWFELYNPTMHNINITNWNLSLIDGSNATELLEGVIPSRDHLIILNPSGSQSNNGMLVLYDNLGEIIDQVTYGNYDDGNTTDNAPDGYSTDPSDECVFRIHDGIDTNIDSDDFHKGPCTFNATNNRLPEADFSLFFYLVNEDSSVERNLSEEVFDPDGDDITYSVLEENEVDCEIVNETFLLMNATDNWNGMTNCTILIDDGYGSIEEVVGIEVTPVNDAPTIISPAPVEVDEEDTYLYDVEATDVENDTLTYSLLENAPGMVIDPITGLINFTPDDAEVGYWNISVKVEDATDFDMQNFTLIVYPVNDIPVIDPIGDIEFDEEEYFDDYDLDLFVGDVESADENISWSVGGNTANLNIDIDDETHVLNISADEDWYGERNITLTATDEGDASSTVNVTVIVNNVNDAPYFTTKPNLTAIEAIEYVYDADAHDIDSNVSALEFFITTNPGGATINRSTGEFRWTPNATHFGLKLVEIKVTDQGSNFTTREFNLTVLPVLDIVDITIDGQSVEDGDTIDGIKPGHTLDVEYTILNRFPAEVDNEIIEIISSTELSPFGFGSDSEEFNLEGQETETIILSFDIPYDTLEPSFTLDLEVIGEDLIENDYWSEKTINFNVDRDFHRVELIGMEWSKDDLTCDRDTTLLLTLANTGDWDEEVTISVYDGETLIGETDYELIRAEQKEFDFDVLALGDSDITYDIVIKYRGGLPRYTIEDSIEVNVEACLDVSTLNSVLKVNESESPSWSPIDLKNYTFGNTTGVVYEIVGENDSLINCNVTSNGIFSCGTPLDDLFGISVINMSVGDVFEQFNVEVLEKNDPPVINATIPGVEFDEGEDDDSIDLDNYGFDVDGDELTWSVANNQNIKVEISGDNVATISTFDQDWFGSEEITFVVSDGQADAEQNITVNVNQKLDDIPYINDTNPAEGSLLIGDGVDQDLSVNVIDPDNISPTIKWFVNAIEKGSGDSFTFVETTAGTYEVLVEVQNSTDIFDSASWSIEVSTVPITTFGGTIQDVTEENVANFTGLTIENSHGKIDFGDAVINLKDIVNIDDFVKIEKTIVSIDSGVLDMFDIPNTTITLSSLTYNQEPVIYFSDEFTTNPDEIITECTSCTLISFTDYPTGSGTVVFNVTGFSSYKVRTDSEPETPPPAGTGVLQIKDVDVDEDNPKPDEIVEIVVEVENDGDLDIEDIELEIKLLDEDGDVVKDEDNDKLKDDEDFDLDEGDEEEFTFTFKMPTDAKDGDEYTVYVEACGKDDDGVEQCTLHQSETIEIERKSHEVIISSAVVSPSTISCYDSFDIVVGLKDIGKKDEDVELSISSNELEISSTQVVELKAYDRDEYKATIGEAFTAPSNLAEGTYIINVRAEYDDEEITETLYLTKAECKMPGVVEPEQEEVTITEEPVVTEPEPTVPKTKFTDTFEYMILLSILIVLILGLVIFAVGAVIIRNK
ncbi:hypothetical protein CEE44_00805 [Candidatus Woesearchaeota archaeon B3_Woes]|nr:MAG: hypothetical protein CEE44_00805 [Candidatus Woesearchaeota archaeon B3_Woes]